MNTGPLITVPKGRPTVRDPLAFRLAATLKRWSAVYLNWRLRQAAIAELAVLSDRELKDMGLTRGEIEGSVTNASKCEHAFNR